MLAFSSIEDNRGRRVLLDVAGVDHLVDQARRRSSIHGLLIEDLHASADGGQLL